MLMESNFLVAQPYKFRLPMLTHTSKLATGQATIPELTKGLAHDDKRYLQKSHL
jgi:hypothetical protein